MIDHAIAERASSTDDDARWRFGSFGPASEEPYRRRPSDYLRLVVAAFLVAITALHEGHATQSERDLFTFVNQLPDGLHPLFSALHGFAALWAIALFAVSAFIADRRRLARDLAIAAAATCAVGYLLGAVVTHEAGLGAGIEVLTRFDVGPSFPYLPLAVITAVISAAAPYVMRPVRRGGQVVVGLLALAALYLGAAFPNEVLAAVALGWGVAACVHLVFGSPGGRPTRAQVRGALAELGVAVHDVQLAPYVRQDGTVMLAHDDGGRVHIRVLGRDEADAQLPGKFWRFALYKDGGPEVHLTRLEDVEQEAFALLLAERSGAFVPSVLAVGTAGRGTAVLATRAFEGACLADVESSEVTDDALRTVWHNVSLFHDAGVSHGRLNARHIRLTEHGPEVVDFSAASSRHADGLRRADVAELLVSTATIVGERRAVSCALQVLGSAELASALPYLQTPALSPEMQAHAPRQRRALRDVLAALRGTVADTTGANAPELQQLYRANATNVLMAIGSLVAVGVLLSQIGDPGAFWNTISSANWWWLALALAVSLSTNVASAIALAGTVPVQLPLWRTTELQLSMSFSNLAVPAVGGMASQVRFLQKQGVDATSAVAAGVVLSTVANLATYLALFGLAVALAPDSIQTGSIPTAGIAWAVLVIVVVLLLVFGVIRFVPKIRSRVVPQLQKAAGTIIGAMRSPRRVVEMVAGNALNAVLYGLVLLCCIAAFGGSANFWTVLALNIFVGTIASAIPIPGGDTAVRSVGMSGALTAIGVPTPVAVAAVLASQLVSNYLPALPGWFATKDLLARDYL